MRVLLAGISDPLYGPLRVELARRHDVRTLRDDGRDRDRCLAEAGCDVLVHGLPDGAGNALDIIDAATRGTWNLLTTTRARRYIQLSSMRLFETYAPGWDVHEGWSSRPTTNPMDLAHHLAEVTSREIARARPVRCLALRLDEVVPASRFDVERVQPRWLHLDDAVTAIAKAVDCEELPTSSRWAPLHIVRGGPTSRFELHRARAAPFSFAATHQGQPQPLPDPGQPTFPQAPPRLTALPRPGRILLLGAGGPLGAAAANVLRANRLRLTDIHPLAQLAAAPPQSPGAPKPRPAAPPHEERLTDITNPDAVYHAATDMECVINCTVIRDDPVRAFQVNVLGAYNMMRAAVDAGIRRVVQTGPALTLAPHPVGYTEDRAIESNTPPRPGDNLYFISKYAGQEICRIFAERHEIACPTLLFCGFVNPDQPHDEHLRHGLHPFSVSWADAGRAIAAATRVNRLPEPCPIIHVLADSPHGRYRTTAARDILRWRPRDGLDRFWYREAQRRSVVPDS